MLLSLKLTLVPGLILLISLAGARWGARVAGLLAGFPIVAGPILLFFALEQGNVFAARSAVSTLYGLLAISGYCLVFCWLSLRLRWWLCLLLGWLAFVVIAAGLRLLPPSLPLAAVLSVLAISVAPHAFPSLPTEHAPQPVPRHELVWRLGCAALLVLSITAVADWLGASWSGLFTLFPVAGSVLGVFALRAGGAAQATALLRGMITGLYGLWWFFLVAALALPRWPLLPSFSFALVAAIAMQAVLLRRSAR